MVDGSLLLNDQNLRGDKEKLVVGESRTEEGGVEVVAAGKDDGH